MADAFTGGLAIGLVIMAALLLVTNTSWSGIGFASSGSWFTPQGVQPELVVGDIGASMQIGEVITTSTADIDLGRLDITGVSTVQPLAGGVIQSGVLFGDQFLRYSVENPKSIQFTVTRTNSYGPLLITVNGQIVKEWKAGIGDYTIPLNMEGPVEIEFSVIGSGWKIWAPTLYEITNVRANTIHPVSVYNFAPGEDFVRAELRTSFTTRQGTLSVDLNGKQLYSGSVSSNKTVSFDKVEDLNMLSIRAADGATFIGTARLVMFYEHVENKVYETTFNLTSDQRGKLPGHIVFEVPNVQNSGTIIVKLQVGDQTKLAESLDLETGTHAVAFFASNIVPDVATRLTIEGSDGALFYVRNLKVWV